MRLMVYSHDAFGLGNIRRMLAICEHLLYEIPKLSILLLSGSPMLQGFRLPKGLDYIKLPSINRGKTGEIAVKYLDMGIEETIKLRSELILSAAVNFQPDLLLVDKKPYGLKHELTDTLNYLQSQLSKTKIVLLLRDILDSPEKTVAEWQKNDYYEAVNKFYHKVLIVGTPEVFDAAKEYEFPQAVTKKVRYCGYVGRQPGLKSKTRIREELQVLPEERLVLVTPGGGEDGYELVDSYLSSLALLPAPHYIKSLIICGSEMPIQQKQLVYQAGEANSQIQTREFTDDLMSYIEAADVVVSMAGYNTVCEILSAGKPAVIIPRYQPSQEQLIRAIRMAELGFFKALNPENITTENFAQALLEQLAKVHKPLNIFLDMNALPRIAENVIMLLYQTICERQLSDICQKSLVKSLNPLFKSTINNKLLSTNNPQRN
jgi:predicted glycosyltransferase